MNIQFIDTNYEVCIKLQSLFNDCSDVKVYNTDIFEHPTDCVVTAGNSFGIMDGGIDLAVREYFGQHIENDVKAKIYSEYHGELLVGQSFIIETDDLDIPFLLYAPTMRVPLDISYTANVYLAMKSILLTAKDNEHIDTISICGLGTLTGNMDFFNAAHQMRTAYDAIYNKIIMPTTIGKAKMQHDYLISRTRL